MSHRHHYLELDGLRGIAAFAVVSFHFSTPLNLALCPHGYLAVDFFFALSGFIVASAYEEKLRTGLTVWKFAEIRLRRLWPMMALGVALGSLAVLLKVETLHIPLAPTELVAAVAAAFAFLPYSLPSVTGTSFPINPPEWSLFYELIVNFAYAILAIRLRITALVAVVVVSGVALALLGHACKDISGGATIDNEWSIGLARVCFSFTAGLLIYRIGPVVSLPLPLIVSLLIGAFAFPVRAYAWAFDLSCITILFPLLVIAGAGLSSTSQYLQRLQHFLGEISYPLYAIHYAFVPTFSYAVRRLNLPASLLPLCVTAEVAGVSLITYLAWRYYDRPVRTWLASWWKNRRQSTSPA